jgi:hypothetical protein
MIRLWPFPAAVIHRPPRNKVQCGEKKADATHLQRLRKTAPHPCDRDSDEKQQCDHHPFQRDSPPKAAMSRPARRVIASLLATVLGLAGCALNRSERVQGVDAGIGDDICALLTELKPDLNWRERGYELVADVVLIPIVRR